ncbi:MAG: 3-dehydroquinate dehydratase [Opitutaceae bacterium]|jgi:3-dehydroquinate dehydratase-2|nr:3-dehydroquinate dehydratase [Opitutaceae bacterium]
MKKIAILNGPNLDRLGKREPGIYGMATLADIESGLRGEFGGAAELEFFQSNHEGALIDKIGALADAGCDGLVINPGGLSHTSVALRDAIAGSGIPAVEVHLSHIHGREAFRHVCVTAGAAVALVSGFGAGGYAAAVRHLLQR